MWCTGKNCTKVFESKLGEPVDIHCECGAVFCFGCNEQAHRPIDCKTLEQWNNKVGGPDTDGSAWIKLNTKNCPKCKVPIEKNRGCMHMTCSKCHYGFCWLCLGDINKHNYGPCSSVEEAKRNDRKVDTKDVGEENDRAEFETIRLRHYENRYRQHQNSVRFAE